MALPNIEFSIVLLTFNRETYIKKQLPELAKLKNTEVIVVDNFSDEDYSQRLAEPYENVFVVKLDKNYGAVGRNYGIQRAKGQYIVTLDDDVWGITNDDLIRIKEIFEGDSKLQAICFKVLDECSGAITNWCHHRDPSIFSETYFETYEISEGAVAFRRQIFDSIGLYPEEFFISHEGLDLAFRIVKEENSIIYHPSIVVTHAHAIEGRKTWRRYYYDTRNLIWLAYRHYNLQMLVFRFPVQMAAMLCYSIRDGFLIYFFRAIKDGVVGLKSFKGTRDPLTAATYSALKELDKFRPPLSYYIKRRIFKRGVKI